MGPLCLKKISNVVELSAFNKFYFLGDFSPMCSIYYIYWYSLQDISCRLKNILQRDFGILNDDIEKPGRIEDHHLTKALNILKEKRRQVKNVSIGSISQVFIMNKGAYLASAPCHNTGCFLPCPKVRAYFGHPGTKCLEFPKWHWLILAPMGALDYEYWAGPFVHFEFCCVVLLVVMGSILPDSL